MNTEIRTAGDEDIPGIVELIADRIGDEDAAEAEMVLQDPAFDRKRWFVAAEDQNILSTAGVFPGQLKAGPVTLGAGAVEFVATKENAEGRGLVRRMMSEIHSTASSRGEMVQWIVGITYFYRKFGYEYAIPVDGIHLFAAGEAPPVPAGWSVRDATANDVPAIGSVQRETGAMTDVSFAAIDKMWDFYRRSPAYRVIVAEGPGGPAYGRVYAYDDDHYLFDVAARSAPGIAALVNSAADGGNNELSVMSRPAIAAQLNDLAPRTDSGDAYYVRAADPVALLEALRPQLSQRLARSDLELEGDALISLYGSSVRFKYGNRGVGPMRREGPVHAPISAGGSGVAPDQIVSLILGPRGAAGLAEIHPDVNLGDQEDLMQILFPPQTCDVHSWVVP